MTNNWNEMYDNPGGFFMIAEGVNGLDMDGLGPIPTQAVKFVNCQAVRIRYLDVAFFGGWGSPGKHWDDFLKLDPFTRVRIDVIAYGSAGPGDLTDPRLSIGASFNKATNMWE